MNYKAAKQVTTGRPEGSFDNTLLAVTEHKPDQIQDLNGDRLIGDHLHNSAADHLQGPNAESPQVGDNLSVV
ncbi:hypothetical protein [Desulfoluna spongiiphila]|uniref:hypothetical protein n=1 Tax=Desulfoluna spongiiphila TaxID=419481 RepID=UPI00125EC25E|nr:hypothetical protein [Desulfoluna spongiiphila]